jgi:PPIC-type PPIASE domain/SurA-like N-terminal domain
MINVLRKNSRWLWFVIAILAIPFVFYFVQRPDYGSMRSNIFGKLYGRPVSTIEIERGGRMFDLARDLGMINFLQDLVGSARTEQEAKQQFALNLLILRHELNALGVRPTSAEIASAVSNLRAFRGESGFDINRYNDAVKNYLGPRGFSEAQIEELAADQVCLDRIKQLLGTGVSVSEAESKTSFEQLYGKLEVGVIHFNKNEVANEVKISDDDIKQYYEAHKDELKSDEKRKVQFLVLGLSPEQKKLTGRERVDALQKLADKANDVSQALAEKGADFGAVAIKFQLSVNNTGEFTQASPDPQLKQDPQLADAAFQLSTAEPTSEPIQVADGFNMLHLASVTPAKPLTLEEAKPKIIEALKATRERELLSARGGKAAHDLREALKSGDTVTSAAQKLNLKMEKLPPFALADDLETKSPSAPPKNEPPDLPLIKQAVADLKPKEVTEPLPTADGVMVAVVEKRDPPDAAQAAAQRASLDERLLRGKRTVIFYEWLRERRRVAGAEASVVS